MPDSLTLDQLSEAVAGGAAFRRVRRMQPIGGKGDKVFPPTHPNPRDKAPPVHVFERRRVGDDHTLCVLVDSVQSQANRMEEALLQARELKQVAFPAVSVDFGKTDVSDIGVITTLHAPHRIFDAIVRDSEHDGKPFKESQPGQRLIQAKQTHARAVFEISPTALLFGAWNSTGEGGGMGAKFPRTVVSEIVGIDVATDDSGDGQEPAPSGKRTGSRIDPLGIRAGVKVFKASDGAWTFKKPKGKSKEVKPSEINHSNIAPSIEPLGVSCDHFVHTFTLSMAALRRIRLGADASVDADRSAQTVLAALALVALTAQDAAGYFLRSRCDLVPDGDHSATSELIDAAGKSTPVAVTFEGACALLSAAVDAAKEAGVVWNDEDISLTPQSKLVELVEKSRELALQGAAEAGDEE